MAIPLLPTALVPWCTGFLNVLSANPGYYRLQPSDLPALSAATSAFLASQLAVANPQLRSGSLIKSRDDFQDAYYRVARPIYLAIQANPEITDEQKVEAGVHVKRVASPIGVPSHRPEIDILSSSGRSVKARLHSSTSARRGRPDGCAGAQVWIFAGENPPETVGDWWFWGTTTRPKFEINFPSSVEPGTKVWLCAAWIDNKGQTGPASFPVSSYTQFGGVMLSGARGMKSAA